MMKMIAMGGIKCVHLLMQTAAKSSRNVLAMFCVVAILVSREHSPCNTKVVTSATGKLRVFLGLRLVQLFVNKNGDGQSI